jgi:hypothetical protein
MQQWLLRSGLACGAAAAGGAPTVEMSFSSNPFFSNNLLRRCLGDEESGAKAVTTDIQWKDSSHNLTVKVCACMTLAWWPALW